MSPAAFPVRVDIVRDEAPHIRSYVVSRIDGLPFPAYEPGAHVDVTSPSGVTRQYSLCGDPDHLGQHTFTVKREVQSRGGSRSLHDHVEAGMQLVIGAPRNLFRIDPSASEHVLIAAGIGITPLLSMAYRLSRTGARFALHYFVRDTRSAAFVALLSEAFAAHVTLHVGIEPAGVDREIAACLTDIAATAHVYTCGPNPFMGRVIEVAERTLPPASIHLERFTAEPDTADAQDTPEAGAFDVEVASTGARVRVAPGKSIVEALATIDIVIDTSCGEGVCGTCMIGVVSGEPAHRDHCLSKSERAAGDVICCCVSRSITPVLVLDL